MVWCALYRVEHMRKVKKYYIICIGIFIGVCFFGYNTILILSFEEKHEFEKIGIIDTNLSREYDKLVINQNETAEEESHGDMLVQFLKENGYAGEIFYYSAINEKGEVDSKGILNGLEWMKENNVKIVNISLSSSYYDMDLENWINENSTIKVYASYNNRANSFDYPAMYSAVVGSGKRNPITYKDIDKKYRSYSILVINKTGIHSYKGNSFLSIISALESYN